MTHRTQEITFVSIWFALWFSLLIGWASHADDPVRDCTTDTECEIAAEIACDAGRIEFCELEGK